MHRSPAPNLPSWLSALLPPNIDRYTLDVGDKTFSIMELGDPKGLPVVMAHGNPTWGFLYRHVAKRLESDGLRLIMPDMIGLGFSSKIAPAEHSLVNHGTWFGGLLDALDLPPSVFVIQDWGGPITGYALTKQPERLAGLVVLNTVLGPPKPGFRPTAFHRAAHMPVVGEALFRGLGMPQGLMQLGQGDRSSIRGSVARAYRYPIERFSGTPLALARMVPNSHQHASVAPLADVRDFMESFRGPAAIVWGSKDPVLGSVLGFMQRLLPQASVNRTQAGHFLQEEVPEQIAAAVQEVVSAVRAATNR